MDSVFLRFDSYNFDADPRFVAGLKSLNKSGSSSSSDELLDLKLFFYNRCVEPIDRTSYKQRNSPSCVTAPDLTAEQPDQRTASHSPSDPVSTNQAAETAAHTETKQLSFAEVMQLVQEGKEVPGVTKLDVQPSNHSPTPSQMERRFKPWETAASSK